jgi:hypothetical protein
LNRLLRRVFGRKKEEITGGWRKLHKELQNLYSLPNVGGDQIKEDEMNGTYNMHRDVRNAYEITLACAHTYTHIHPQMHAYMHILTFHGS